jgi:hypothetical protein
MFWSEVVGTDPQVQQVKSRNEFYEIENHVCVDRPRFNEDFAYPRCSLVLSCLLKAIKVCLECRAISEAKTTVQKNGLLGASDPNAAEQVTKWDRKERKCSRDRQNGILEVPRRYMQYDCFVKLKGQLSKGHRWWSSSPKCIYYSIKLRASLQNGTKNMIYT